MCIVFPVFNIAVIDRNPEMIEMSELDARGEREEREKRRRRERGRKRQQRWWGEKNRLELDLSSLSPALPISSFLTLSSRPPPPTPRFQPSTMALRLVRPSGLTAALPARRVATRAAAVPRASAEVRLGLNCLEPFFPPRRQSSIAEEQRRGKEAAFAPFAPRFLFSFSVWRCRLTGCHRGGRWRAR